jgi:hypothetical protein
MPAAIRPYSMAVAPRASSRKCRTSFLIGGPLRGLFQPEKKAAAAMFRPGKID